MPTENTFGTVNHFGVTVRGPNEIKLFRHVNGSLTKDAALNLAAYLVLFADEDGKFEKLLEEVKGIKNVRR